MQLIQVITFWSVAVASKTKNNQWVPVNCFNQLITHARSQDLGFRTSTRGFRTWISGSGFQALDKRALGFTLRTSTRGFRTWISGPGFQALGIWLSAPGFQALGNWLSGPGFQDLESTPSYGRLIFFPSLFSASTATFLFPVTFLCVHRHFSLRPVVTDGRTDATSDFIYKIGFWAYVQIGRTGPTKNYSKKT